MDKQRKYMIDWLEKKKTEISENKKEKKIRNEESESEASDKESEKEQRSQVKLDKEREKRGNHMAQGRVEEIASIFGETRKKKQERETSDKVREKEMNEKAERSRKVAEMRKKFEVGGRNNKKSAELVQAQVRDISSREMTTKPERKKEREREWVNREIVGRSEKENFTVSKSEKLTIGGKQTNKITNYRGTPKVVKVTFEKSPVNGGNNQTEWVNATIYQTVVETAEECQLRNSCSLRKA